VRQDVEYLLESDRFICAPKGYEVIYFFIQKGSLQLQILFQ
jgi:hypothetical protein